MFRHADFTRHWHRRPASPAQRAHQGRQAADRHAGECNRPFYVRVDVALCAACRLNLKSTLRSARLWKARSLRDVVTVTLPACSLRMREDHGRLIQFDHKRNLVGGSRPAGEPISCRINTGVRKDDAQTTCGLDHRYSVNGCPRKTVRGPFPSLSIFTKKPAVGFGVIGGAPGRCPVSESSITSFDLKLPRR